MLSAVRTVLDCVLAKVIREKYDKLKDGLSYREVDKRVDRARKSLDSLKQGGMPNYHDDWVALLYLIRYQPRQVNLVYAALNRSAPRSGSAPLCLIDIGCGAWAVPIAVTILAAENHPAFRERRFIYHGIEPSKSMYELGQDLWLEFGIAVEERQLIRIADVFNKMTTGDSFSPSHFPTLDDYRNDVMQLSNTTETPIHETWLLAVHALYKDSKDHIKAFLHAYRKRNRECLQYEMITSDEKKQSMVEDLVVPEVGKQIGLLAQNLSIDRNPVSLPIWEGVLRKTTKMRNKILDNFNVRWDSTNDIRDDAIWVRCAPR